MKGENYVRPEELTGSLATSRTGAQVHDLDEAARFRYRRGQRLYQSWEDGNSDRRRTRGRRAWFRLHFTLSR